MFDRFAPGQNFKLLVAGARLNSLGTAEAAELRFGPNEQMQKVAFFQGDLGKGRPALIFRGTLSLEGKSKPKSKPDGVPAEPIGSDRIAAVNALTIGTPLRRPVRLALGSMRAPFAALDKCTDDLLVRWGVDPVRHATLTREATPKVDPSHWITSNDYPSTALMRGAQGIVDFRMSVDENGSPTGCHIQQSTRPPEFDTTVCKVMMKHAQFLPALDKDGKPFADFFRSSVTFVAN